MTDSLTYRSAGVDIEAGDRFVDRLREIAESTHGPAVVPAPGGFAGLFRLSASDDATDTPLLVACTDGVGTKLRIAFATGRHDTVGIDLVAMSVNDCIVTGARPLFFLDYIGTGTLDVDASLAIMQGIGEGCRQSGCALLGGETAEMPDMYPPGEYDLAGFCVGVVGESQLIDGRASVAADDVIIGLPSSGLHSNGFSLVRRALLDRAGMPLDAHVDELGRTLGEELLEPTRIYVAAVMKLLDARATNPALAAGVHGMCHITGGGLPGNLPRVLPDGCSAEVDRSTFDEPAVFRLVQQAGNVEDREMWRVFNRGIGFTIIVAPDVADEVSRILAEAGESPRVIGTVRAGANRDVVIR